MRESSAVRGWTAGDGKRKRRRGIKDWILAHTAADGGKLEGVTFSFYLVQKEESQNLKRGSPVVVAEG